MESNQENKNLKKQLETVKAENKDLKKELDTVRVESAKRMDGMRSEMTLKDHRIAELEKLVAELRLQVKEMQSNTIKSGNDC